jgi:hypothetical protein
MQSKPIRNSDFDAGTSKHVTFYNENFKRGRCDLLKKIQRSTRGGGTNTGLDQSREVHILKEQVATLEITISEMSSQMEERMRRLELDMLGRMEQMMLAMQQQQQTQMQIQSTPSTSGDNPTRAPSSGNSSRVNSSNGPTPTLTPSNEGWDPLPFGARGTSIGSLSYGFVAPAPVSMPKNGAGPTLPPHPKQKQLPSTGLPGAMNMPPSRLNSLRGLSGGLTRGISGLSRGDSINSQASAMLRNSWEDKFFSMLMLGENEAVAQQQANAAIQAQAAAAQNGLTGMSDGIHPTPMADHLANMLSRSNAVVSNSSSVGGNFQTVNQDHSSVSSGDIP